MEADVRMLSETLLPRSAAEPENLKKVADFIAGQFRAAGHEARLEPFEVEGATYFNVVANLGPAGGERLVIGAHYDAYSQLPGADDNASGVAGLLEVARLLENRPLSQPVEMVAYCLEEPPHYATENMGSARHVRRLKEEGTPVKLMICLEMIGYYTDEKDSQGFPVPLLRLFYPSRGNFIAVVGKWGQWGPVRKVKRAMKGATELPVYSINAPAKLPGIDFSDHRNYWAAGIPAVMITDTAFYRNENYHQPTDTWDTLDYPRMAQCAAAVTEAVLALAGGPDDGAKELD